MTLNALEIIKSVVVLASVNVKQTTKTMEVELVGLVSCCILTLFYTGGGAFMPAGQEMCCGAQ